MLVCDSADKPMDQYSDEPTLADMLSDPVTLAVMDADGIDPGDLSVRLILMAAKFAPSPGAVDHESRSAGDTIAKAVPADRRPGGAVKLPEGKTNRWHPRIWRNNLRL